jgi:hypothetical protein
MYNSVDSVYIFFVLFNGISSVATLFSGRMKYDKQKKIKKKTFVHENEQQNAEKYFKYKYREL